MKNMSGKNKLDLFSTTSFGGGGGGGYAAGTRYSTPARPMNNLEQAVIAGGSAAVGARIGGAAGAAIGAAFGGSMTDENVPAHSGEINTGGIAP